MLPLVQTEALVLRTVNFQEADRVVTLLARDVGKISALARGARKSVRRFSGVGTAALGNVTLRERGGDLWSLESFEVTKPRTDLGADLVKAAHAAYACELVERLVQGHGGDSEVFHWLDTMLDLLERAPPSAERLRCFELGLLERLGLAPPFDRCGACGRTDLLSRGGRWVPESGLLLCPECGSRGLVVTGEVIKALRTLASADLAEVSVLCLSPLITRACRGIVMPFIEHHVGGPLKSMIFLSKMARAASASPQTEEPLP
ncbi:MAG: DNA repair protein RecO [Deltaproteobacteria bacterium]|nr:DNA repair protein RecO [Deltaproteobacteria bacterium]